MSEAQKVKIYTISCFYTDADFVDLTGTKHVVLKSDYDALSERLRECETLLRGSYGFVLNNDPVGIQTRELEFYLKLGKYSKTPKEGG